MRRQEVPVRVLILVFGLVPSILFAEPKKATRNVAQELLCPEYFVVEVKVHDNGIKQNVPGGAFVHGSVFIGVGASPKDASENAKKACEAGKYSPEGCQDATATTYSGNEPKYRDAVKTITGCRN